MNDRCVKICGDMDNFGVFAAWVGIAAFVLSVPMAIIGNLLTPRVQAVWARTTQSRKNKRIAFIHKELDAMRVVMKPKFRHEHFVLGMVNLARAGGSFLFLLMVAAFQAMLSEAHFHHASGFLEMMLSFGLSQSKVYILLPLAVELTYLIGFFYLNKAYKCFYSSSQI